MINASLLFCCDCFSSKEFEMFAVSLHCKFEAIELTSLPVSVFPGTVSVTLNKSNRCVPYVLVADKNIPLHRGVVALQKCFENLTVSHKMQGS